MFYKDPTQVPMAHLELGVMYGNSFKVSECADEVLDTITNCLCSEDKSTRPYRRQLASLKFTQKALLPSLFEISAPEYVDESEHLFEKIIRVLVNLTTPIECLINYNALKESEEGQQIIEEIELHLFEVKSVFLNSKLSKAILERAEKILNKESDVLSLTDTKILHDCVTLVRNVLHIPDDVPARVCSERDTSEELRTLMSDLDENQSSTVGQSKAVKWQNQILWNLFAHNLDTIVIKLIASPHLPYWSTSLMQLIALVYKDQHVNKLERLLSDWLETSLSESSEDNESNTSPQDQNRSCSSPTLTSAEPTDDSSDGAGNGKDPTINSQHKSPESGNNHEQHKSKAKLSPNGHTDMALGSKDTDMRSESSDSCAKEPPCKKAAFNGNGNGAMNGKANGENFPVIGRRRDQAEAKVDHYFTKNEKVGSGNLKREMSLKRSAICSEQDSGFSSPQSNREAALNPNGKGSDSGGSLCESCDCSTTDCTSTEKCTHQRPAVSMEPVRVEASNSGKGQTEFGNYHQTQNSDRGSEQQESNSNSTSSNEDDMDPMRNKTPHTSLQKPRPKKKILTPTQRRELKRKKLIQRAKSNRMKVKAIVQHVPTDDDIADLLKEFTVDFLLKGYSSLVLSIHRQLLSDTPPTLDKSHFLWLITYFLKFASQLEVELEQIGPLLSVETLMYLIFEGVEFCEEFELAVREHKPDLRAHIRRLHLLVTAMHEFIETLKTYSMSTHFAKEVREPIQRVMQAACRFSELRQLCLLLIRRYNPNVQSRQYLMDLIICNHSLLVMIETSSYECGDISGHLTQFASVEVMRQYGLMLESFKQNSEEVNDCVFTMMHHVAGDLNSPESLFIPQILQRFSDIWEQENINICDDWADLIEYVIQRFVTTMGTNPHACASNLLESSGTDSTAVDENGFTKGQLDNLYFYYTQSEAAEDPVGAIIEIYKRTCNVAKTRLSVIQALLSQGIITLAQYMSLMYMKSVLSSCKAEGEGSVVAEVGSEHCDSDGHDTDLENGDELKGQNTDQIEVLKGLLKNQGKGCLLAWIQQVLLDACYVKVNGPSVLTKGGHFLEPVSHYYNYMKQSIPMIPWNKQQEMGLQSEAFILLLHKLGFHLPADVGKCFPRIPHFWSADHIYQIAQKLGQIKKDDLKMDLSAFDSFKISTLMDGPEPGITESHGAEDATFALPIPTHCWIQIAARRGSHPTHREVLVSKNLSNSSSVDSLAESYDSNAFSLEKMQLSDENETELKAILETSVTITATTLTIK